MPLTRIRIKDCIVCGKPVPKTRYSLCSRECREKQKELKRKVTIECSHCSVSFSFFMTSFNHCRRYCDNCQKKSSNRSNKDMREMMKSRRNYEADESSCPAAWIPSREYPEYIGSAMEPAPISGSEYEEQIKTFLEAGGKITYLPIMPADTGGYGDNQLYFLAKE